jgi:proline iminopeptidase
LTRSPLGRNNFEGAATRTSIPARRRNLKDYDITNRQPALAVRALFLCGRYDETRPEETSWYQSLVPGAEMVIFEDSSHVPHLEEPERFLQVVRDFLRCTERAPGDE